MTTSFAELKRSRKSVYDKIVSETNKMQSGGGGGARWPLFSRSAAVAASAADGLPAPCFPPAAPPFDADDRVTPR